MTSEFNDYEQKRVQEVKGSFYIYLPKEWATKYSLMEQKKVLMKRLDDDSLLLRANSDTIRADTQLIIDLDFDQKPDDKISNELYEEYLFNKYLTAYIIGFQTIIFKKRTNIPLQLRSKIRKMTQHFHGMMVINESETSISIEDSTSSVDLRQMMKQILNKVGISMGSLIEIIENDLKDQIGELIEQDDQIDEHRYAIERTIHRILRLPTLALMNKTNAIECLHHSEVAKMVERMGDYVVNVAKIFQTQPLKDKEFVVKWFQRVQTSYNKVYDLFDRNDSLTLFLLVDDSHKAVDECDEIINSINTNRMYFTAIRRLFRLCADIAEIRINDILSREYNHPVEK